MDINNVIELLKEKFERPLDEYYKRRIIFWNDTEQSFIDSIDEIEIENVNVIKLTGSNNFYVKKLLSEDDLVNNYLIYCPIDFNKEHDWLLDIKLYSETFRTDLVTIVMDELGIEDNPMYYKVIKYYIKYFGNDANKKKFSKLDVKISNANDLHLAVLASIVGASNVSINDIIKSLLAKGLENNNLYCDLEKYNALDNFWKLTLLLGYNGERNLRELFTYLLINSITKDIDSLNKLDVEKYTNDANSDKCYEFIRYWQESKDSDLLKKYGNEVSENTNISAVLEKLDLFTLNRLEGLELVDKLILNKVMDSISNGLIDVNLFNDVITRRRTSIWYCDFKNYYEACSYVLYIENYYKNYENGYHTTDATEFYNDYVNEHCLMDTYYRKFYLYYNECINNRIDDLDDLIKQVALKVEEKYIKYLSNLSECWTKISEDDLSTRGYLFTEPLQRNFYSTNIDNKDNKGRVYVIISDAMRYEVGAELVKQLKLSVQSQVELSTMQAVFPTVTEFGMAALLPHKDMKMDDDGNVLVDDINSCANNRETILKKYKNNAVVLKYNDFMSMKRSDKKEAVKGSDIVYIYHDKIDGTCHHDAKQLPEACEETINELTSLVRSLVSDLSASNIMITADHGFLYTYNKVTSEEKVSETDFKKDAIKVGPRHVVVKDTYETEYLMNVKSDVEKTGYKGYSPRENTRIKIQGNDATFVHGGASLQEFIVPLIKLKNVRNNSKEYIENKDKYDKKYTEIKLIGSNNVIYGLVHSLNFYQVEPVVDNVLPGTYELYFVDENNNKVTVDTQKIIANSSEPRQELRQTKLLFNFKPRCYSKADSYYLIINRVEDNKIISKIEFEINISTSTEDLGFDI